MLQRAMIKGGVSMIHVTVQTKNLSVNLLKLLLVTVIALASISVVGGTANAAISTVSVNSPTTTGPQTISPGGIVAIAVDVTGNVGDPYDLTVTVTTPVSSTPYSTNATGTLTKTTNIVTVVYPTQFSGANTSEGGYYDISVTEATGPTNSQTNAFLCNGVNALSIASSSSSDDVLDPGDTCTITFDVATENQTDVWTLDITVTNPDSVSYTASSGGTGDNAVTMTYGNGTDDFTPHGVTTVLGAYTVDAQLTIGANVTNARQMDFVVKDTSAVHPNPHLGTFSSTADECAACHRAHTAKAPKLLKDGPTQKDFCFSCHKNGIGAYTDVANGVYYGIADGDTNHGLRGGGFENAKMDIMLNGNPQISTATSSHRMGAGTVFGSAFPSASANAGENVVDFTCGNCHNPHGNDSYRILRPQPTVLSDYDTRSAVVVPDETAAIYTINYDGDKYRKVWDTDVSSGWAGDYQDTTLIGLTDWCSFCHTAYLADSGAGHTPAADALFTYRHWTVDQPEVTDMCEDCHADKFDPDGDHSVGTHASSSVHFAVSPFTTCNQCHPAIPYGNETPYTCLICHDNAYLPAHLEGCLACHVAHGTSATMGAYSSSVPWPSDMDSIDGYPSRSSLLWLNNRGVCVQCHSNDQLGTN